MRRPESGWGRVPGVCVCVSLCVCALSPLSWTLVLSGYQPWTPAIRTSSHCPGREPTRACTAVGPIHASGYPGSMWEVPGIL